MMLGVLVMAHGIANSIVLGLGAKGSLGTSCGFSCSGTATLCVRKTILHSSFINTTHTHTCKDDNKKIMLVAHASLGNN